VGSGAGIDESQIDIESGDYTHRVVSMWLATRENNEGAEELASKVGRVEPKANRTHQGVNYAQMVARGEVAGPRVYADAWFFRKVTLRSRSRDYESALVFCPVPDKSSPLYRHCVAWATYTALYACATDMDMNIEAVILPWMHKDYKDDVMSMIYDGTLPDESRVPPLATQFSKVIITRSTAAVGSSLGSGSAAVGSSLRSGSAAVGSSLRSGSAAVGSSLRSGPLVIHSMGILGLGPRENGRCTVPANHALVDPAGLGFIKRNDPGGAGELSKALYKFVGVSSSFPLEVRQGIRNPCDAVYHKHEGGSHVIHVVGPDFRKQRDIMWHDAVAELTQAYVNVLNVAEDLSSEVRVVRIPLISGGVFAGKFNENGRTCVPELTARAVVAAMNEVASSRGPLRREYWLCTFTEPKDTELYQRAYDFARSVRHYDYKKTKFRSTASPNRIAVSSDAHPLGAVGYAVRLGSSLGPRNKIGVMVAANSGRPGGSIGKSLEEIPTIEHAAVTKGFNGGLKTQEESVVSEWLNGECKGGRECGERLFRSTICGLWGQSARQVPQTIQGVEYTNAEAAAYGEAWVVRDAKLLSRGYADTVTATLVFVAGPNANAKLGSTPPTDPEDYGSMYYTTNRKAAGKYDEFKKGVEASVRAGLLAMQAEGVTHALVAYVSGGIYAGEYRTQIRREFERLVSEVASAIGYDATIVIVDRRS
jgi:hypothetical protein